MAECLAALLEEAARYYAADSAAAGCLVLEGVRCNDREAREAARAYNLSAERVIREIEEDALRRLRGDGAAEPLRELLQAS